MGSGNAKNKVKSHLQNQNNLPPLQIQQQDAIEQYKKQLEEENESENKSDSFSEEEQKKENLGSSANGNDKKNINFKRFSKTQVFFPQINNPKEEVSNNKMGVSIRIPKKGKYESSMNLQPNFSTNQNMGKSIRRLMEPPKIIENTSEDREFGFKQAHSIKSFASGVDNSSALNVNKKNNNNLNPGIWNKIPPKTHNLISNFSQLNGSGLFKSTRRLKTSQQFTEEKLRDQNKIMLKSMKNIQNAKEDNSDTSSYQSSAYSNENDNQKTNKLSEGSPDQKISPVNTPISLRRIKLSSDNKQRTIRKQMKKFSQKTVKELLDQNIFQQQFTGSKEDNFEVEQDKTSIQEQMNIKQENWIHGSISKISSVATSEKGMKESSLLNSKKENKLTEENIDERNTFQTSKNINSFNNEITSQNLKTKQELDHPVTNHTSQSTFKKAYIQRDKKTATSSISSLQDLTKIDRGNNRHERENDAGIEGEQNMLKSKRIKLSQKQLMRSLHSIRGQNSLQERDNEEGSQEFQNTKRVEKEKEEQKEEDDEDDDDDDDEQDEEVSQNFLRLARMKYGLKTPYEKQSDDEDDDTMKNKKKINMKKVVDDDDEEEEEEIIEELNDSLVTTYDLGFIDPHPPQKGQYDEIDENKHSRRQNILSKTDLYQKVKRVYIRTTLEGTKTPVQYYSQKKFKFEWVTAELQQMDYFHKKYQEKNPKAKNQSPSSSSSSSDSQKEERGAPMLNSQGSKKRRYVGGTMYDQELHQNNKLRNAVSDQEDSQMFANRKNYLNQKSKLSKFFVAVSSRKGNREDDLPIQDDYLFYRDQLTTIYGVFDGHGPYGHHISSITFKLLLTKFLCSMNCYVNPQLALKQIYNNISGDIQKYIQQDDNNYNQYISGVSCAFVVRRYNTLIVSNVGDTKAIVFKKNVNFNKKEKVLGIQLTEDHVPTNADERKRIYLQYGEVKRSQDFCEKVYVRGRDFPALHLTRSIGDQIAHEIGVSSDPHIKTYEIDQNDNFLLVATASIFELLSIEDLWSMISPFDYKNITEASRFLQTRIQQVQKQQSQLSQDTSFILSFL